MGDNGKNFVFDSIQSLQFLLFLPDRFFKLPHRVFTEIQGQENEHQPETIIDDLQYSVWSVRVAGQEGSQRKVNSDDTRRDPAKRQYDVPSVMQEKEDKEKIEKKIDFQFPVPCQPDHHYQRSRKAKKGNNDRRLEELQEHANEH